MNEPKLDKEEKNLIIELYKSHHTARETAMIMNIAYGKVSAIYRGFKVAGIPRYAKIGLIEDQDVLNSINM